MTLPRFYFTQYEKYFKVYVENLESLSVAKIQEIEFFVQERNGVFDFNSYTFFIQKRVNFEEFTHLLKELGFPAISTENFALTLSKERVAFGEYKGMFYSELPLSYLLWLKGNYFGSQRVVLDNELKRRGV